MRKGIVLLISILFSVLVLARENTLLTSVYQVLPPEKKGENFLVLAYLNGEIFKILPNKVHLVAKINEAINMEAKLRLTLNAKYRRQIDDVEVVSEVATLDEAIFDLDATTLPYGHSYSPTNVTMGQAERLYNSLVGRSKNGSQCYKRAHVWAKKMYVENGIKSMKSFLFYTKKYIREHSHGWWFHVAPFVRVGNKDIVLDYTFTDGPMELQDWARAFVPETDKCPVVSSYNEYYYNQEERYCYIRRVSMYYFQPADIQKHDNRDTVKNGWVDWELKLARKAFKRSWRLKFMNI